MNSPISTQDMLKQAQASKSVLSALSTEKKNEVLLTMADCLLERNDQILEQNRLDVDVATGHMSSVMIDRLMLNEARISDMAAGIRAVAALPDPVGVIRTQHRLPNGLFFEKTSASLGVIAIIYESRPNVTSDAASLAFKSGNACVLRGGKESFRSNQAITQALKEALGRHGLPDSLISLVQDTTRQSAKELMTSVGLVDLLIPRGGAALIKTCIEEAKVPCIQTGTGICHIYVDESVKIGSALDIIDNAKTSRPSVCNSMEVCLVHQKIAPIFLSRLKQRLVDEREAKGEVPVELRLDSRALELIPGSPAGPKDFDTEFLDYILAIAIVDDIQAAISHINRHSTGHSDAILTETARNADTFTRLIDSAAVYVNASTRFTDGGVFGLGCEMGISTQKLHARGPMGLEELTTYKYIVKGSGQIR